MAGDGSIAASDSLVYSPPGAVPQGAVSLFGQTIGEDFPNTLGITPTVTIEEGRPSLVPVT